MAPRVFVSAGEPSGDLHAAAVVRALADRVPGVTVEAFGGPCLEDAGASVRFRMEAYTAFGFVEVVEKIPRHLRLLRRLARDFAEGRYDLLMVVDYTGFNVRLAEAARKHGVPVLYYVAPQLWAWRPGRARRFARAVDRVAVILPFEREFFAGVGVDAEYVGHPLVEHAAGPSRTEARRRVGASEDERILALLPGSRGQEVRRLWPRFREAARQLVAAGACDRVIVGGAPGHALPEADGVTIYAGPAADVLVAADAALAKSGTITLEAALADTPMVVAYRVHPLTSMLARRLLRVEWISLVNLVAGRAVVPELVQEEVAVDRLVAAVRPLLDPSSEAARLQREGLALVRERLNGPGAAGRVADQAVALLRR